MVAKSSRGHLSFFDQRHGKVTHVLRQRKYPSARNNRWRPTCGCPKSSKMGYDQKNWERWLPSGKHTKNNGKIHHFSWENPLFLWQFSIAMLNYQRVTIFSDRKDLDPDPDYLGLSLTHIWPTQRKGFQSTKTIADLTIPRRETGVSAVSFVAIN